MSAFDKNKAISKAQKLIQAGKIDQAINEYVLIVQNDPRDAASLQKLAGLYAKKKQVPEAVKCYERVGQSFTQAGFYQKALAVYKLALDLDRQNPRLLLALGDLYATLGLKADAQQHFQQSGTLFLQAGDNENGLKVFDKLIKANPDDYAVKARYGEALIRVGRKDEGVAVFRQLAQVLQTQGKFDELAGFYERILGFDSGDHATRRELARVYVRLGFAPKALKHLKDLFDARIIDAETFDLAARVYTLMGKNDKAVQAFLEKIKHLRDAREIDATYQRILEIDPTNEAALRHLGGGAAESEVDLTAFSTREVSKSSKATVAKAEVEIDLTPPPTAVPARPAPRSTPAVEAQSVRQSPQTSGFASAINEASVYIKYGILDRAIEQLLTVVKQDPSNVVALERLFEAYRDSGEKSRAVETAAQLIELYEAVGEMGKSQAALDKAKALDPTHPKLAPFLGGAAAASAQEPAAAVTATSYATEPAVPESEIVLGEDGNDWLGDSASETGSSTGETFGDFLDDRGAQLSGEEAQFIGADGLSLDISPAGGQEPEIEIEMDDAEEIGVPSQGLAHSADVVEVDDGLLEQTVDIEVEPQTIPSGPPAYQADYDEACFLLDQGLYDEAEEVVVRLRGDFPGESVVAELAERLRRARASAAPAAEPAVDPVAADAPAVAPATVQPTAHPDEPKKDDGFGFGGFGDGFDLASELESELGFLEEQNLAPGEEDVPTMEEIFAEFKKGVKQQLSDSDSAAHYDLGIAYMEMGLVEDAVGEFEIASQSPEKAADAYNMIAMAKTRLGNLPGAIEAYRTALALTNLTPAASLNLTYELAVALEDSGDIRGAVEQYKKVLAIDSSYRQVMDRLRALRDRLAQK